MGIPNKAQAQAQGFRGDKPNPAMAAHAAKMAQARAQAEKDSSQGGRDKLPHAGGKGFAPSASHSAASMIENMQAQLEMEMERRRALGEEVQVCRAMLYVNLSMPVKCRIYRNDKS